MYRDEYLGHIKVKPMVNGYVVRNDSFIKGSSERAE